MIIPKNKIKNDPSFRQQKGSVLIKGFGQIPKLVMQDKRLSIEAKAIYAYLCSYAGGTNEVYPSVSRIISDLDISENRFYRHFKPLIEHGYIQKYQTIDSENIFKHNVYELMQVIET